MLTFQDKVIHVDPWSNLADYSQLPKADIILVTHEHGDHLDLQAIDILKREDTTIVLTEACLDETAQGLPMKNGDNLIIKGIEISAVPAYNIEHKRDNGEPFHPKGRGNGYILNFAELTVYIAEILKIFGNVRLAKYRYCFFTYEFALYYDSGDGG